MLKQVKSLRAYLVKHSLDTMPDSEKNQVLSTEQRSITFEGNTSLIGMHENLITIPLTPNVISSIKVDIIWDTDDGCYGCSSTDILCKGNKARMGCGKLNSSHRKSKVFVSHVSINKDCLEIDVSFDRYYITDSFIQHINYDAKVSTNWKAKCTYLMEMRL